MTRHMGMIIAVITSITITGCGENEPTKGWQKSNYHMPVTRIENNAFVIEARQAPAGTYFVKIVDPDQRYRLTIVGSGDPFTLRLRKDEAQPTYMLAPETSKSIIITDTRRLEVLLYSDTPAKYAVSQIDLSACLDCKTKADLIARIKSDIPGLDQMDRFSKALALLKWAAETADWSVDKGTLDPEIEQLDPVVAVYEVFDKDKKGVYCGAQSVFYRNILWLFELDAFTINFGEIQDDLTHVSVVFPHAGHHYLLDPTFAGLYMRNGEPVPIRYILTAPQNLPGIEFRQMEIPRRSYLDSAILPNLCRSSGLQDSVIVRCSIPGRILEHYFQKWRDRLSKHGIAIGKSTVSDLMRKGFFSVGPALRSAHRDSFLDLLKQSGIRLAG